MALSRRRTPREGYDRGRWNGHLGWVGQNHNVTAAFGSSTSGTHDAPHSYQITFNTPGAFTYRCTNHIEFVLDLISGMAGIIEVR
jgi:plastocyanin